MHTFLQKKIFFCDTSARSFGVKLFVYFHACLFSLTPHTYKILKFWHSFYNTYLTKLFSRNEASMGAEFIENKALLDMCYKNCARTSILYVCRSTPSSAIPCCCEYIMQTAKLLNSYITEMAENSVFERLILKPFWGSMPPDPPTGKHGKRDSNFHLLPINLTVIRYVTCIEVIFKTG